MQDYGATWFDRFWNSTLGLPQQVGYRLLRVAQGDAELLSEEGLLDKSLLPIIGIADDHTKDVSPREMTERVNRVIGGDGIGEGWKQDIGVSILTDPLSFMGSALTGGAKLGQAIGKAANVVEKGHDLIAGAKTVEEGVGTLRAAIELGGKSGKIKPEHAYKALTRLDDALRDGKELGMLDSPMDEILGMMKERNVALTLPMGIAANKASIRVSANHRGWFSLMGEPLGPIGLPARGFSLAWNGVASRNIPIISPVFREVGALAAYTKFGLSGAARMHLKAPDEEFLALAEGRGGLTRVQQLARAQDKFQGKLETIFKGMDGDQRVAAWGERAEAYFSPLTKTGKESKKGTRSPGDAFRLLINAKKKKGETAAAMEHRMEEAWNSIRERLGLNPTKMTEEAVVEFASEFDQVRAIDGRLAEDILTKVVPTEAFDKIKFQQGLNLAKLGEKIGFGLRKAFISPSRLKAFDSLPREVEKIQNSVSASQAELAKLFWGATDKAEKAMGMKTGDLTRSLSITTQTTPMEDEFQILGKLAMGDLVEPKDIDRFVTKDFPHFMDRLDDAVNTLDSEQGGVAVGLRRGMQLSGFDVKLKDVRAGSTISRLRRGLKQMRKTFDEMATVAADEGHMVQFSPSAMSDLAHDFTELRENIFLGVFSDPIVAKNPQAAAALKDYFKGVELLQKDHLDFAKFYDLIGDSRPIAYAPRALSPSDGKRLEAIVGPSDGPVAAIVGELRASKPRAHDSLTMESVDEIIEAVRRESNRTGAPELQEALDKLVELTPELKHRYSPAPHTGLIVSLSQMRGIESTGAALDKAIRFRAKAGEAAIHGGELTGVFEGNAWTHVTAKLKDSTREGIAAQMTKRLVDAPKVGITYLDSVTGKELVTWLSMEEAAEQGIHVLGKGRTPGEAFGKLRATGGETTQFGARTGFETVGAHVGEQVVFGPKPVVDNLMANLGQVDNSGPAWARMGYDQVHNILKTGVTIVRPDFHVFNMISSVPMLHMAGAGMKHIFGGIRDARSFVNFDAEWVGMAERMALVEGESVGFFGRMARAADKATTRAGGLQAGLKRSRLLGGLTGHSAEFSSSTKIWHSADGMGEAPDAVWRIIGEEGLLNGLTREATGRTGRESRSLARLATPRRSVRGDLAELFSESPFDAAGRLTERGREAISLIGEIPEAMMRMAGVFAFKRMGQSTRDAVKTTLKALVDYSDLTPFETKYMKRAFSFYSFPRKMIPNTLRYINQNPGEFAATAKGLYGLPGSESEMGTLSLRPEGLSSKLKDYRVNIQRALPQLDVISQGSWLSDFFMDWRDVNGSPERKSGMRFAIPIELMNSALGVTRVGGRSNNMGRVLQEGFRSSYLTRWALADQNDPLRTKNTVFDHIAANVFGVRKSEKAVRQRWTLNQFRLINRELTERLAIEDDADEREALKREMKRSALMTQRLLK